MDANYFTKSRGRMPGTHDWRAEVGSELSLVWELSTLHDLASGVRLKALA